MKRVYLDKCSLPWSGILSKQFLSKLTIEWIRGRRGIGERRKGKTSEEMRGGRERS